MKEDANQTDVREAFLQKARDFHPDRRPDCLEYFTHVTKAYETLSDVHKRAIYDDEQMSDEAFFSIKVRGYSVNMLSVLMGTALVGVGYYASKQLNKAPKEGACPVDHSSRNEMVKFAKK